MNSKSIALLNVLLFVGVLTVNALANILPINGLNTGEVSALYPSLFTPAGFTFSVWSVIYLLLLGFIIIQWRMQQKPWFHEVSLWFLLSCLANISWILVWHHLLIVASVTVMLVLLFSLTQIFLLLQKQSFSTSEFAFIKLPFTIYFSWICVATIANISALLVSIQWHGEPFNEVIWTVIMLVIAAALSTYITVKFKVPGYALITVWALFGIFSRWVNSDYNLIANVAIALAVILALVSVYVLATMRAKIR